MSCLYRMSIEELGSVKAIALCRARHLLLPVVAKLLLGDEEVEARLEYRGLPEALRTSEEYYANLLHNEEARLDDLKAMTTEEIEESRRRDQARRRESISGIVANARGRREVCRAALHKVKDWRLPSRRHKDLKRLMISELEEDIEQCQREVDRKWSSGWPSAQAQHDDLILGAKLAIERHRERARTVVPEIKRWNRWLRELHEACETPDPQERDHPGECCAETT